MAYSRLTILHEHIDLGFGVYLDELLEHAVLAFSQAAALGRTIALGANIATSQGSTSARHHCAMVAADSGCASPCLASDSGHVRRYVAICWSRASICHWRNLVIWNARHRCFDVDRQWRHLVVKAQAQQHTLMNLYIWFCKPCISRSRNDRQKIAMLDLLGAGAGLMFAMLTHPSNGQTGKPDWEFFTVTVNGCD